MSGRVDRLLVWRSIRCDAPGLNARSHAGVENVSRWFPAQREPRQSTRLGLLRDRSLSRSKDASIHGTSVLRGLFAPRAAISLRLTRIHGPGLAGFHPAPQVRYCYYIISDG
jgi:hypothetical protein